MLLDARLDDELCSLVAIVL
jgi:hypothetical protein